MRLLVAQAKAGWSNKMGNFETYESLSKMSGTGAVQKMYESRKELSRTGDWSKAMNEFRNHMHNTLLPIVRKISEHMPAIASAGKLAVDNLGTLALLMASLKIVSMTKAWAAASAAQTATAASATKAAVATTAFGRAMIGLPPLLIPAPRMKSTWPPMPL